LNKIIIAIDGFSSCGKSTLARQLAAKLGYAYIDSGAMYRAVTLFFIQNQIDLKEEEAVSKALENIHIHFENLAGLNSTFLNQTLVEKEIRQMEVSELVSPVATISQVRRAMVAQQKEMGKQKGIVMDGRDIGTVVFPQATLKLFITADTNVRAQRRFEELRQKGTPTELERVCKNLKERDHIDSNRADSPLRQAEDAVIIDNTNLTESEQLVMALALAQERIAAEGAGS